MPGGQPLLAPSASTHLAAVIGDPVRHSLSPTIHNAAYRAMGVDWVYVALPVPAGRGAAAVEAMRTLGLAGMSVTMPHKAAVLPALDRLSDTARRLGAVNTVSRHGDDLVGDSTDGAGFIDALREERSWEPPGRRCLVLGTGGAARAVSHALGHAGAASVGVVGRRPDAAASCAALAGGAGAVVAVEAIADADIVVNATPAGMPGRPDLPFDLDPARLGSGQLVVDLIYNPRTTPLMVAARAQGAAAANGLGMLIHQAARQIAVWTGQPAPIDAMRSAVDNS
ncbi:shikimate dehydrogenase [Acidiferrimicrobium sp. IK]|uniref:shikimate dehydrogenase n=1 Tax=Acidiferrimicrobium sp. IK TaxID=2871700 RepID=UPI0021CB0F38|nr:shikimate dehydrogenase [Acidiferrimicrobium sp. IK]MCU4184836.1 shikimate dehydrogenase [Acidiferrimicrobium sp. IK]